MGKVVTSAMNIYCPDCNPASVADMTSCEQVALVCSKCLQRRLEQKKTIQEIVDTEISYGRDLRILKEEFYNPMKATGLLSVEQLEMVFINLEELINVNAQFTEKLQCAVSASLQINNHYLNNVHIGRLFIESSQMFHAFEMYCVGQALASQTLEQLEREKELLHVFLQVSQRDNAVLRRMHLKSFLMVPVQRIMRYPLLLCRLYKSTPNCHKDKEDIKQAQERIEDILSHINARTKSSGSFHIKRKRTQQRKYSPTEKIEVNRVALEVLGWNKKEVTELITSRLMVATTTDHMWAAKKCKNLKFTQIHGAILTLGQARLERRNSDHLVFPRHTQVQQAAVVLVREKNGKYQAARDPMFLDKCVITVDPEYDEVFELHEWGREPSVFKAEDPSETKMWIQLLRQQTRDLGKWRMRRNAMPNIMIKNMI
ncbi:rho guanine nucleotide exchange factor 38-like [Gigantopelta aegis]|uniref:rho guanine nucleotide exchange factor 38-like n=1 Tax=Gigantopelta aegis TaxID=1735272 RepID=UPI001B888BFF|nr:rho guanine nucleotide exchange factor 38-like [Gigantopelta aegis]